MAKYPGSNKNIQVGKHKTNRANRGPGNTVNNRATNTTLSNRTTQQNNKAKLNQRYNRPSGNSPRYQRGGNGVGNQYHTPQLLQSMIDNGTMPTMPSRGGGSRNMPSRGGGSRNDCPPGQVDIAGQCYDPATTEEILIWNNEHCWGINNLGLESGECIPIPDDYGDWEIPNDIQFFPYLKNLSVAFPHGLTGVIPPSIGVCTNLEQLLLFGGYLTGSIPSSIGNLTNLEALDLGMNQLTGEIPPEIGNLTNLTDLRLYDNQLTGEIPPEIGNLTNLWALILKDIQLTGEIPPEIGNLTNLERLYLNDNQLTGEIPSEIGNLTNLHWLFLSDNQLTGQIPPEIGNLTNLNILYLHNNQLTGFVSEEICNVNLVSANNNQLCPPYPDCITQEDIDLQDTSNCYQMGDVNQDNILNVQDAVATLQHILGGTQLDYYQKYLADMNQDGNINITDVVAMIQQIFATANPSSGQRQQLQNLLNQIRSGNYPGMGGNQPSRNLRRGGKISRGRRRRGRFR